MANTIDTIRCQARNSQNRFQPGPASRNAPLEIDAIRRTTLSLQEREHLRKVGGCFSCRETGHMARECPRKARNITAVEALDIDETDSGKDQAQ
jgi:succinate dehydrogenase/fumarate reductase-like Fe-S protein